MRTRFLIAATVLAASCSKEQQPALRSAQVTRGPISEVVSATGEVSAVVTVAVGSQISGTIARLFVDFNSPVKKGELLAEIDTRLFEAALQRAEAALAAARAEVERDRVAHASAARTERRFAELAAKGLVASADAEAALATRDGAAAALRAAQARVLQARAERDAAATNLTLCRIRSPIDGIVISRNVDVGQTVATSLQSPTLFLIANDLSRMRVLANVDEADVGKVREGLEARFTVDAYPGLAFRGLVRELRQAPTSIQNVVTYAAVVEADNPERKLRQGMTASVSMVTEHRADVLRVPNGALRYRPAADGEKSPAERKDKLALVAAAPEAGGRSRPRTDASDGASGRKARAYRLQDGKPVKAPLRVGISDGSYTEVLEGLAEGDLVLLSDGAEQKKGEKHGPF